MLNSQGSVMLVWLAIIVPFGIFYAAVYGPEAALFCELFDAKVRYTGISSSISSPASSPRASRPSSPPPCSRAAAASPG